MDIRHFFIHSYDTVALYDGKLCPTSANTVLKQLDVGKSSIYLRTRFDMIACRLDGTSKETSPRVSDAPATVLLGAFGPLRHVLQPWGTHLLTR